jgi:opacity protein-like surface antigen
MKRTLAGVVLGCSAAVSCGSALAAPPPGPVTWQLAAGFSEPTGQISNYLQGGWALDGTLLYAPSLGRLALRADLGYSNYNASQRFLAYGALLNGVEVDSGYGNFFSLSVGPQYSVPFVRGSHLYGFAQLALLYTDLQLTQSVLFAGPYCDPFFGFCDGFVGVGDAVVYDDSRTRLGWDAGIGIDFPVYYATYFLEVGYHRTGGSQPVSYVPITFGFRF